MGLPKVAYKTLEQGQEERRQKGSHRSMDGNKCSPVASKQSRWGFLHRSGLCPMSRHSSPDTPLIAPRQALFWFPPHQLVRNFLLSLGCLPSQLDFLLSFLQLNLKIYDHLLLRGQVYLSRMQFLALLLSLPLCRLQTNLNTRTSLVYHFQFLRQFQLLLLNGPQ